MTDAASSERPYANRPVRVGVQLQPQHAEYSDIRRAVTEAEEAGVDIIFNWDHFYPLYGDADGKHFEAWTMLGAWAEQTERVQIGALVSCNSYRNPDLLADMARTVDNIADGRLILGIGSGWFEKDYTQFGYEFGTAGGRLDALAEALPRIEARLAVGNPAPKGPMPILIGGGGETKTLRITARHASIWHYFGDAETMVRKHAVIDKWCEVEGRDPGEIERSVGIDTATPDEVGQAYLDAGTRLFTLGVNGPDYDLGLARAWVEWRDSVNGAAG